VGEVNEGEFSDFDIQFPTDCREVSFECSVSFTDFSSAGYVRAFRCNPKPISYPLDSSSGIVIVTKYVLACYIRDKLLIPIRLLVKNDTDLHALPSITKFPASKE